MKYSLKVNGEPCVVDVEPGTPLLWVLREHLQLPGTKFGCGMAQCGACMVLLDGSRTFACQVPIEMVASNEVITVEGLKDGIGARVKQAWLAERVPQCGYCQSGQMISAVDLLSKTTKPSRKDIREHMSTNLCRCGTYDRITRAIERAVGQV